MKNFAVATLLAIAVALPASAALFGSMTPAYEAVPSVETFDARESEGDDPCEAYVDRGEGCEVVDLGTTYIHVDRTTATATIFEVGEAVEVGELTR